jgi:polyisoprenyl-phosphate glycosyltransferase
MIHPKKISVVFSVYNEAESLGQLFDQLQKLFSQTIYHFEILFVDDGSTDQSAEIIRSFMASLQAGVHSCRLIRFSRNFGHEAAMIAGMDHASGDAVICMDADLQHPLEMIPGMTDRFELGYEVVSMVRKENKGVSPLAHAMSRFFYRMLNLMSPDKLHYNASDFFLVSANVASVLRNNYRERTRFLRGIIQTIGFKSTSLEYVAPPRIGGKTKYSLPGLIALTAHAVTSFSKAPLYLGIWFGFIFAALSIVLAIYTMWVYLFGAAPPSGYTTIVLFLSISFSILFFLIGIIGIYVGHLFEEQKGRPIYLVEEIDFSGSPSC